MEEVHVKSSINPLLEKMRRLQEQRAKANVETVKKNSINSSVSSVSMDLQSNKSTTLGSLAGIRSDASTRVAPTNTVSVEPSEVEKKDPGNILKGSPPNFSSPANAVLCYRDRETDPLCGTFTSLTVVDILKNILLDKSDSAIGVKRGRKEDDEGGNEEDTSSSSSSGDATRVAKRKKPDASAMDFFLDMMKRQRRAWDRYYRPDDEENEGGGNAQRSLHDQLDYRRECEHAHIDVSGKERPPCRDVNHYVRRDRIAHGVYGVVFSAVEATPAPLPALVSLPSAAGASPELPCSAEAPNATPQPKLFALKHIKKQWLEESQVGFPPYLMREFDLLLRIRHPNIVQTREVVQLDALPLPGEDSRKGGRSRGGVGASTVRADAVDKVGRARDVFLVMEYCPLDLKSYMLRYSRRTQTPYLHISTRSPAPDAARRFLARVKCILVQLFRGLAFLHAHRVLHRDLKLSNVLLDARGRAKLCDFGLGRYYREGQALTPTVVTLMYRAPELHLGVADYAHTMDVWSMGCVMAELFLKQPLFPANREREHLLAVCDVLGIPTEETFPGLYKLPNAREALRGIGRWNRENRLREVFAGSGCRDAAALPPSGLALLERIFSWCPARRPSAAEAAEHPFFHEDPPPCAPEELLVPMPPQTSTAADDNPHGAPPGGEGTSREGFGGRRRERPRGSTSSVPPPLMPLPAPVDGFSLGTTAAAPRNEAPPLSDASAKKITEEKKKKKKEEEEEEERANSPMGSPALTHNDIRSLDRRSGNRGSDEESDEDQRNDGVKASKAILDQGNSCLDEASGSFEVSFLSPAMGETRGKRHRHYDRHEESTESSVERESKHVSLKIQLRANQDIGD